MTNGRVRRRAALSSSLLRHIASTRINHDLSNRAGEAEGQDVIRTDGRALIPTDLGVFHPGGRNCSIQMLGTCRHIVHRQGENSPARPLSRLVGNETDPDLMLSRRDRMGRHDAGEKSVSVRRAIKKGRLAPQEHQSPSRELSALCDDHAVARSLWNGERRGGRSKDAGESRAVITGWTVEEFISTLLPCGNAPINVEYPAHHLAIDRLYPAPCRRRDQQDPDH